MIRLTIWQAVKPCPRSVLLVCLSPGSILLVARSPGCALLTARSVGSALLVVRSLCTCNLCRDPTCKGTYGIQQ
jgi:hypothetical protein